MFSKIKEFLLGPEQGLIQSVLQPKAVQPVGRLSDNPVRRARQLMAQQHTTLQDVYDARRTRRYVDGRQRFLLTHLGRPTRLAPLPSEKAVARANRKRGLPAPHPTAVMLTRGEMKRAGGL